MQLYCIQAFQHRISNASCINCDVMDEVKLNERLREEGFQYIHHPKSLVSLTTHPTTTTTTTKMRARRVCIHLHCNFACN
jgi:hypothetical protein